MSSMGSSGGGKEAERRWLEGIVASESTPVREI